MAITLLRAMTRYRTLLEEPYYTVPKYSTGKVALVNGSPIVRGAGTAWIGNVKAGESFFIPHLSGAKYYTILYVDSDTRFTLTEPITEDTTTLRRSGTVVNSLDEAVNPRTPFTVVEVGGSPNMVFSSINVFESNDAGITVINLTDAHSGQSLFTTVNKYYSANYAEFTDATGFEGHTFSVLRNLMNVVGTFSGNLLYVPSGGTYTFEAGDVGKFVVNVTEQLFTTITAYLGPGSVRVTNNSIFNIGDKIAVCRSDVSGQALTVGSSPYGIIATDIFEAGDVGDDIFNISSQQSTTITGYINVNNVICEDAIFTAGDRCVIIPVANVDAKLQVLPYAFLNEPAGTIKYIDDLFVASDVGLTVFNTSSNETPTTIASITANKKVVLVANKFTSQNQGYAIASYSYEVSGGRTTQSMAVEDLCAAQNEIWAFLRELDENYFLANTTITPTSTDATEYTLPATCDGIVLITNLDTELPIPVIPLNEMWRETEGWYFYGNKIMVKTKSASFKVDYVTGPTNFTDHDSESILPDICFELLCLTAANMRITNDRLAARQRKLENQLTYAVGLRENQEPRQVSRGI